MPLPVSYMGTKRQLAATVAGLVAEAPEGPFLDAFSGMCAVASEVGTSRQIWTNDLQRFAQTVSRAHFCGSTSAPDRLSALAAVSKHLGHSTNLQIKAFHVELAAEDKALDRGSSDSLKELYTSWREGSLRPQSSDECEDLFVTTYAGSYFSLFQTIEIDGIRSAIDFALAAGLLSGDDHRWLLLALCVCLSKCSTSTGHFAQPLSPKPNNIKRFAEKRRRSVRGVWLSAIDELRPCGTAAWRHSNRAERSDANELLMRLSAEEKRPSVIYADPPYTDDQYSRYYHLYETLILYDYPEVSGTGRYRPERATSDFSLSSRVEGAIENLIRSCAALDAEFLLSYPTNGLLPASRDTVPTLIKEAYGRDAYVLEIEHEHSTMGGSKGSGKSSVTEVIYRARH